MVDKNKRSYLIEIIFSTQGFLGSLIMKLTLDFKNSIWRIQDVGRKFEKISNYAENLYIKVYRVVDYESDLRVLRFNMADPRWRKKIGKIIEFCSKFIYKSFWATDNEFDL